MRVYNGWVLQHGIHLVGCSSLFICLWRRPCHPEVVYRRLERRCPCSSSSSSSCLAGKEAAGRAVHSLSAGTELVSWAQIQQFGPLPVRWRVVATLSPRASLALLCMAGGKLAEEILTACRPGNPLLMKPGRWAAIVSFILFYWEGAEWFILFCFFCLLFCFSVSASVCLFALCSLWLSFCCFPLSLPLSFSWHKLSCLLNVVRLR